MPLPRIFFYFLVYKWLVLVHSETLDGVLLNARSSNAKAIRILDKDIRITRQTSVISQKIEGFGGRPCG